MPPADNSADRLDRPREHELWRRACAADAPDDLAEAERFLDLAALAEGRLDADDIEEIEALVHADSSAASDVAEARELHRHEHRTASDAIVARACALVAEPAPQQPILQQAQIIAFPAARRAGRPSLPGVARWASLAAAVLVASWIGFNMGADVMSASFGDTTQASEDELLDPSIGFIRDFTESVRA